MTTLQQTQNGEDGLEWLRHIRRKMSAECWHDPVLLIENLRGWNGSPGLPTASCACARCSSL